MSGREVCNKAANFCALLAQAMEAGAGEPGPGGRLRQCEREFRAWARDWEESPSLTLASNNPAVLAAERERDNARARADVAEARLAKVDAAAAEMVERVKYLLWLASGAPMHGEEPLR